MGPTTYGMVVQPFHIISPIGNHVISSIGNRLPVTSRSHSRNRKSIACRQSNPVIQITGNLIAYIGDRILSSRQHTGNSVPVGQAQLRFSTMDRCFTVVFVLGCLSVNLRTIRVPVGQVNGPMLQHGSGRLGRYLS